MNNNESTVLSKVFSLFCSTDEMRPQLLKPFKNGNYTYATDGTIMVRCENERIDFEYENNETPPNAEKIVPEVNMSEILDLDAIDWVSLMNTDETIGDGNDVECGHCDGQGSVEDNFLYKGKFYDFEYECPVCDGSGYEEEEKEIPTGRKNFGAGDKIKLKNTFFVARKFYKIKMVKDIIGGDVELISYNGHDKAVVFKIQFLEIIIMPILFDDENAKIVTIQ